MQYRDINTQALRDAVNNFKFYSAPSNADSSAACTVKDLRNVITQVADLLNVFIDELEN